MKKINIIGSGFSGLSLAYELAKRGVQVEIYERASRIGGLLGTDSTDYGIAEKAANALIRTSSSIELFKELDLIPSQQLTTASKRYFFRSTPKQWPLSLFETCAFIFKFATQAMFGRGKFRPQAEETLEAWGLRTIGKTPTQYILGPAMQGIYGNEIKGLSASLILGPLFQKRKKDPYRGLLTGPEGMQNLVDKLEDKCKELGVRFHLEAKVEVSDLEGPIVIATSAASASELVKNASPEFSGILSQVKMSSIISVTLFFKDFPQKYKGFGCLIPRGLNLVSLGVLMNSYIFKDRDKTYNETWMLGGVDHENLLDLSDSLLISLIETERSQIMGCRQEIIEYKINRWPRALPYYDVNLEKALKLIPQDKISDNIFLHGNYLSGIGLSKILDRSKLLAERILAHHE